MNIRIEKNQNNKKEIIKIFAKLIEIGGESVRSARSCWLRVTLLCLSLCRWGYVILCLSYIM